MGRRRLPMVRGPCPLNHSGQIRSGGSCSIRVLQFKQRDRCNPPGDSLQSPLEGDTVDPTEELVVMMQMFCKPEDRLLSSHPAMTHALAAMMNVTATPIVHS